MANVEIRIAFIEARVERIEQAGVVVVDCVAEGRAEIVNRMRPGVARRQLQTDLANERRLVTEGQAVVVREALIAARVEV